MDEDRGSGWLVFAAVILVFAGMLRIFDAIWAFTYNGAVPEDLEGALLGDSLETYGWWWIITGAILILGGFAVLPRSQPGRWIGVLAAAIGGFAAISWMPYYPIWSLIYLLISVMVIYALTVYGGRETSVGGRGPSTYAT
jgi:hypothetical protein